MRTGHEDLTDIINEPKEVGLVATFRKTLPVFARYSLTDSLGLTDPAWIDACNWQTGILRVTSFGNMLYTQYVPNIASAWPAWSNTGISLYAGSRPAVDGGYVWYQKADGNVAYRSYGTWATETMVHGMSGAVAIAPLTTRAYAIWQRTSGVHEIMSMNSQDSSQYAIFGLSSLPRIDIVSFNGKEYIYTMDRDAGRVIEIKHAGNAIAGADNYGVGKSIVPIDAIDEVYGLKLGYASLIDSKVVVTGRLTRTSDDTAVSFDVYAAGPENFSFGREMFIHADNEVMGKMLRVGDEFIMSGAACYYKALATSVFGGSGHPSLEISTSEFSSITLTEAEARSTNLSIDMSPGVSHVAVDAGSDVELEMAYNDNWLKMTTCVMDLDRKGTEENGSARIVSGVGKSAKRLAAWSPDQGIYIPSQARNYSSAADLTKLIRATGKIEIDASDGYAQPGTYEDTDAQWNYVGTWGVDANQGTPSIHYSNTTGSYAEFKFFGTGFTFKFTKFNNRGIHDIYVDGVKIASVNAYNATTAVGTYTSPALDPGVHTFKLMRGDPQSNYIDVDQITVTGVVTGSILKVKDINKLAVLYSTARASRGGVMRGKFYYPADTYFKPYYGVAVNYYRETAAEAAARLGVEIDDIEDDMFGHNGIVAIYSATEHSGGPGIGLYYWQDSSMVKMTSASLTIPADTWHWLQIEFIEGEIRVKYRLDSSTLWTDYITFMYNRATLPWKRETLGRGAIVIKNIAPQSASYGFGSDDSILAVDAHANFPVTGTLLVDEEQITYSSKTPTTLPSDGNASEYIIDPRNRSCDPDPAYTSGTRVIISEVPSADNADGKFIGMAMTFGSYSSNGGTRLPILRTSKIVAWDGIPPRMWEPSPDWYSGWTNDKGNAAKGFWFTPVANSGYVGVYLDRDPWDIIFAAEMPYVHPYVMYTASVHRGFNISARGVNDTVITSHMPSNAHLYTGKSVSCEIAASFSQEEDQSIEDALKMIVGMAGGSAACRMSVNETHVFSAAGVVQKTNDHQNFICELDLPSINDGSGVGVAFRASSAISLTGGQPSSATGGYYVEVQRTGTAYYLSLFRMSGSGTTLVEQTRIRGTNTNGVVTAHVPAGTLKVSVQDDLFSVWLNGRYLHTFHDEAYADGLNIAFVSRQAATFRIHLSELDDLLADIVVGTRGNGMSVIGELLGDRHILWRDEQDGSLFFYKTRPWLGSAPDMISAVVDTSTDSLVTRMRAEGLNISEIYDTELLREKGNAFVTVNARHANNVSEARVEARLLIDENWRNAFPKKYVMDVHPGLQPGDALNFIDQPDGGQSTVIVRGQSITIGFAGNNFVCEMQCDVVPFERE